MSFFLIRLLQNFNGVTLDMDAQPQRTTSLLEWKTKRREVERDLLATHLILSTKVSLLYRACADPHLERLWQDGIWVKMNEAPID